MPIYEYECPKCLTKDELFMSQSEEGITIVCECGSDMTKVMSTSSFQLKGTGWYKPSLNQGDK